MLFDNLVIKMSGNNADHMAQVWSVSPPLGGAAPKAGCKFHTSPNDLQKGASRLKYPYPGVKFQTHVRVEFMLDLTHTTVSGKSSDLSIMKKSSCNVLFSRTLGDFKLSIVLYFYLFFFSI